MATYSDLGTIAGQPDFRNRVAVAMSSAAIAVYNEAGTVTGHVARASYATKVLNGTYDLSGAVLGVLVNATIIAEASPSTVGNSVPDADIQFQVNAIWSALAGA